MDFDLVIVGGGVVGLACAAILSEWIGSVLCIERHESYGRETSSRNSEVIHAGIYYTTGSLKAKLCVAGNRSLYDWCERHNVPFNRIGKYIVAVDESETDELESIYERGKNNGVEGLCRAEISKLKSEEPYVKAVAALWSADTGIVDTHKLMDSLYLEAKDKGVDFAFRHSVTGIEPYSNGYKIGIREPDGGLYFVTTKFIINSAGLDSDTIADLTGIDVEREGYKLNYCRGHYFRIKPAKKYLANHLIYPVPQKKFSGLGIHVTLDLAGELKLGPDTQYLNNRIQDFRIDDALGDKFFASASSYLDGLERDDIYPDQAGIRPKLQAEGESPRDFIIAEESGKGLPGFVNLVGIESPGLTSCLEIARMVGEFLK